MNIDLIEMDPEKARQQLRDYRRELHRRADSEYEAVAAGLEELAKGNAVISLPKAIQGGGFDAQMRPRLAIARADRRQVHFSCGRQSTAGMFSTAAPSRHSDSRTLNIGVDLGREVIPANGHWTINGFALVPMIPPAVRRQSGVRPSHDYKHFILFEVEQWSDTRLGAQPDRDPYLLRHLGGDGYAVLAAWDLTPLEQMVMAGRANAT